ncbi:MAG TPA: bifunctional sugar-1-phosphate nucleotidylyltransferase/acetyltransferase, partial [Candidatus Bathyarchaeia archaeon]|nr:bifunctional sugar-1-phosphate nucleotidylyltransferase/acetyltransferase [Candidatus Bathyarchaeia archaeon]
MKAAILAAGEGSRLRPLTLTRPKHLIPVGERPLIEYLLEAIKQAGIDEAFIVVRYKAEQIKRFLGDGSKYGLRVEYVDQTEMKGTADAIRALEPCVNEDFLLIYGDILTTSEAIKTVLESHMEKKPAVSMGIVEVEHPEHYGIAKLEGADVIGILEKPKPGEATTNLANAGIYIFSEGIFDEIRQTSPSPRGELEITSTLELLAKENKRILGVRIPKSDWFDIGRPWDVLEANRWALSRMIPRLNGIIEDSVHLIGSVTIAEGARVRSGAYIEGPAFIGQESDIGPNCYIRPYTHIGRSVR